MLLTAAVGGGAFAIALNGGSYGLADRASLAIGVWWMLLGGIAVGAWPRVTPPPAATAVGLLLLGFALFSGLSGTWGQSAEKSLVEADRVALYLGVVALAAFATRRGSAVPWLDGLAGAAAAVAVMALLSRLFPHLVAEGPLPRFLPEAHTRLSYPLNYWNGLAILLAVAVPLWLRVAVAGGSAVVRGLGIALVPVAVCVVYLTSSRSGAIAAVVGAAAFVGLAGQRWRAAGACGMAALTSAVAMVWLVRQHELVNGPLDSAAAESQGRSSALVLALVCAAGAATYGAAWRLLPRYVRPSRWAGRVTVAVVLVLVAAAVVAAHPVRRFDEFKRPPSAFAEPQYIRSHFLSVNGNWRWQYWTSSVDEFRERPWGGGGAGSFEAWWAEHGTTVGFVRNAHSLFFEVLGEVGLPGLLLLVAALAGGLATGAARALRAPPGGRAAPAAATAALGAYVVGAGLDWMWQLTAVSVIGMALLGLCVGPATHTAEAVRPRPRLGRVRLALAALAVVVLAGEGVVLASDLKVSDSQAAARRGDLREAAAAARLARRLEPWASTPYIQLALVQEQAGDLAAAHRSVVSALARDRRDWRLWLTRARIETKLGDIGAARASLDRARSLNPRSPIFAAPANPTNGG